MTVLAASALDVDTAPVEPATPPLTVRPALEVIHDHDHDWRLVQVDWNDGVCVKEYACPGCDGVWFA